MTVSYALTGPAEAQEIVRLHPPCATAPNGTGARCSCVFGCANYHLRAHGFKGKR